jgi:hypothetical protein
MCKKSSNHQAELEISHSPLSMSSLKCCSKDRVIRDPPPIINRGDIPPHIPPFLELNKVD